MGEIGNAVGGRSGGSASLERRIAPRSIPLESRALLGWRERGELVAAEVHLLDISQSGLAAEVEDAPPPADRDIFFCLVRGPRGTCARGEIVAIEPRPNGRSLVRVAFWEPCPRRLLDAAIGGPIGRR